MYKRNNTHSSAEWRTADPQKIIHFQQGQQGNNIDLPLRSSAWLLQVLYALPPPTMSSDAFLHLDMVGGNVVEVSDDTPKQAPALESDLFPDLFQDVGDPVPQEKGQTAEAGPGASATVSASTQVETAGVGSAQQTGPPPQRSQDAMLREMIHQDARDFSKRPSSQRKQPESPFPDIPGSLASAPNDHIQSTVPMPTSGVCVQPTSREQDQKQVGPVPQPDVLQRPQKTALLIIEIQKYCCDDNDTTQYYRTQTLPQMFSNAGKLLKAFRRHRDNGVGGPACEIVFIMLRSMVHDARDVRMRSKSEKSGSKGSNSIPTPSTPDNELFMPGFEPQLKLGHGDVMIPTTTRDAFVSTNLDYVLRSLCITQLVICGQLIDQSVESTMRHAADLGYRVSAVHDACAASCGEHHAGCIDRLTAWGRVISTQQILEELMAIGATRQTMGGEIRGGKGGLNVGDRIHRVSRQQRNKERRDSW